MRAFLSPAAREQVERDLNVCPDVEVAWAASWDSATSTITSVRFVVRGARNMVGPTAADFRSGEVCLHSHPPHAPLEPSPADVELCKTLAGLGVGCGIVAHDASTVFLLRPPGYPAVVADSMRAAAHPRYAVFRLGPLSVMWRRSPLPPV